VADPRLIVFDVDGTLVDSQHNIVHAMTAAWEAHGLGTPSADAVRRVVGLALEDAVAALLPDGCGVPAARVADSYRQAFFDLKARPGFDEPLFPGLRAALDAVETDNTLLGVATGKSRRGLEGLLERHGLAGRFVTLQTPDDGPGKPDPAMLRRALDATGADAAATVMVGDTVYDMRMARAAGTHALGVAWGYHPADELHAGGAHAVAADGADLARLTNHLLEVRSCA